MANKNEDLQQRLCRMMSASPDKEYYALTLTAAENGKIGWSVRTQILGFTDATPRRELRSACLVHGQTLLDLWRQVGTPGLAVESKADLAILLHLGGNAIIERSVAEEYFPAILVPRQFVPTGPLTSKPLEEVAKEALRHAPTPRLRMRVLNRDDYRCRICGRRAEDHVDIELHVHHFRPWAEGGLTEEANLITLCHTCHKGLDPHYDMSLLNVFHEGGQHFNEFVSKLGSFEKEYVEGVRRYRAIVRRNIETSKEEQAKKT